jgi:hypothetical protein
VAAKPDSAPRPAPAPQPPKLEPYPNIFFLEGSLFESREIKHG